MQIYRIEEIQSRYIMTKKKERITIKSRKCIRKNMLEFGPDITFGQILRLGISRTETRKYPEKTKITEKIKI